MQKQCSKLITGILLLGLALPLTGYGASQPSSKVTAKTSRLVLLAETTATADWVTLLENDIKTANQKDLFVGVSLEVGLFTQTLVRSKNMVSDTSTARAVVQVRVLVDGEEAEPGAVVFGDREQTLTAMLEGAIGDCLFVDEDGNIVVDEDCVTPEEIELILRTLEAATFNFVAIDVAQGVHNIEVQARIATTGSAQEGSFSATGLVGKGSMTVESVRLIKGEDVILELE